MRRPRAGVEGGAKGECLRELPGRSELEGFAFVQLGDNEVAINFLSRDTPCATRTAGTPPGVPDPSFSAGPGAQGPAGGRGRPGCPGRRRRGVVGEAPGSAYLCRGALRARNPAGARRCSGVARGRPGQAGCASWLAGCSLPAAGTGRAPASSLVGGSRGGGGSNRHRGARTPAAAAAEEEEVSARGSRFLLPGRASAGEARGGLNPGSPNSVPRDLRGGRDAPSLPTAPCDSARAAWPRRASHSPATAAAVRSTAVSLPSLSLPSRAVHPQPAPGQPASAPRGVGAPPHQPQSRVLARRIPWAPGTRNPAPD